DISLAEMSVSADRLLAERPAETKDLLRPVVEDHRRVAAGRKVLGSLAQARHRTFREASVRTRETGASPAPAGRERRSTTSGCGGHLLGQGRSGATVTQTRARTNSRRHGTPCPPAGQASPGALL